SLRLKGWKFRIGVSGQRCNLVVRAMSLWSLLWTPSESSGASTIPHGQSNSLGIIQAQLRVVFVLIFALTRHSACVRRTSDDRPIPTRRPRTEAETRVAGDDR